MKDSLFVVVWKDVHNDDIITLHRTRDGADARVREYTEKLVDERWVERTPMDVFGTPTTDLWLRYVQGTESGDSASIFVFEIEVEP